MFFFLRANPRVAEHLSLFCVLSVLISVSVSFKLNVPSVLLNYNSGLPSNFTIQVTGADSGDCFVWHSEDGSVIKVSPLYDAPDGNCSQKAIISSVFDAGGRKFTKVTAFHQNNLDSSGLVCEVVTDLIASVEIVTTAHELSVGGPPHKVKVIAKDKFGFVFTSINGLQIKWDVDNLEETEHKLIIRLSGSTELYEISDDVKAWEMRGMLGYSIFVEAVDAGIAELKAAVVNPMSTVLASDMIVIKVLSNIKVKPSSPIYLLKHSSVHINMNALVGGKHIAIDSSDFERIGENSPIIDGFPEVVAKEFGSTHLTLKTNNNRYPDMTLDFHVVKPTKLVIRISGGAFKNIEEMKMYTIAVEMYDGDNNMIHLSDNTRVMLTFPAKLFHVNFTTSNGTYCNVQAIAPGKGKIRAEFKGILKEGNILSKGPLITAVEEVSIRQKLNIFPPDAFLIYEKSIMPHKVSLKATGGTGEYAWAVNHPAVASIVLDAENPNSVEILVNNVTNLVVTVIDKNNVNMIASAKISVQPVNDIETYPTVVEAEIENVLIIPTALLGYDGSKGGYSRKFDDCSKIEPTVEIIEKYVLSYEKEAHVPSFGKGCLSLQFRCKYSGYTRVNIMYHSQTNATNNTTFKTTTVLACFKPLKPVHPVRVAVLALGTSKEVAFEGGPRKWILFKDGHYTKLDPSNPELLDIQLIKDPVRYNKDLTVFRVTCKELGENTLSFRIGNEQSATNHHPAKAEATIKLICAEPASLHLKQTKKKNSKQLIDENIVKVPFYGTKLFSVDVWLKDSMGRKFANISAFVMEWEVSDETLATAESNHGFTTHENAVVGYRKITRTFKEFKMSGVTGNLQVRAKVTKYNSDVLSKEGVIDYKEINEVSNSIDLKLVSLRDINADQYETDTKEEKEGYCDDDSCKV